MVAHLLPKQRAAGSNPVSRSIPHTPRPSADRPSGVGDPGLYSAGSTA